MINKEALMQRLDYFYGSDSYYIEEEMDSLINFLVSHGMPLETEDNTSSNYGEWIPVELIRSLGSFAGIKCSSCGFEKIKSPLIKAPNYCENCGAKMSVV